LPDPAFFKRRRLTALALVAALVVAIVVATRLGGHDRAPDVGRESAPAGTGTAPSTHQTGTRTTTARSERQGPSRSSGPASPRLSLGQLVGQRLIASFRGTSTAPPALLARIHRGELAGVILFAENAPSVARARALAARLQAIPRPRTLRWPLLVMIDQEGGSVRRLADAPPSRAARQLAAGADPDVPYRAGLETARALRRAGVNVDLAPVADVPRDGSVMAAGGRTFGRSSSRVAVFAGSFARGLVEGHVEATAKHFPGLGDATVNTDEAPATIELSRQELRREDYSAFRAVIENGAGLVMLSNAIYPGLDPASPATLSRGIATHELRDVLGFRGVSVTDDLEAGALRRYGTPGEVATKAAIAGADLLLFARTYAATEQAAAALEQAVGSGRLSRPALEHSAERVLALRKRLPPAPG
jgi:beta-N-acetylhexosaminidase